MDRRIFSGVVVSIALLAGCSRSESSNATAPAAADASAAAAEPAISMPAAAAPGAPEQELSPAEEMPQSAPDEAPLADPSTNPLRRFAVRPDEGHSAPPENPLRELPRMMSMAAPPGELAGSESRMVQPSMAAPRMAAPQMAAPRMAEPSVAEPPSREASALAGGGSTLVESGSYDVVQVFYGTDRLAVTSRPSISSRMSDFVPAGCSLLVTLATALTAMSRRKLALWLMVFGGVGVSLGLGFQAAAKTVSALRRGSSEVVQYTSSRSANGKLDLGICDVSIPRTHVVGELEAPSILRLEVREDAARHIVLQKIERLGGDRFQELLRERVDASPRKELFVFVHGFNVSFEDAARRTAQMHYDLKFSGAPVFFSWPAHDKFVLTYAADETNVVWSAPHLKQFLLEVAQQSGARSINLIAHSMGNRALTAALREIELTMRREAQLFNQVVLAAPDIDADEFRNQVVPAIRRTAQRLTLYASSRDDALLASQLLHRGPRAGDAGEGLVVTPGIDTIDVTAIDSSPWGHIYYGSSSPVLEDLKLMFTRAAAPRDRAWLSPAERNGLTYWIFQPTRTATSTISVPR
jgi:esterase/lipase superfamily enzyme